MRPDRCGRGSESTPRPLRRAEFVPRRAVPRTGARRSSYARNCAMRVCAVPSTDTADASASLSVSIALRAPSSNPGGMRQPFVLGGDLLPLSRLRRKRIQLIDDPAQPLLLGDRACSHLLGLSRTACASFHALNATATTFRSSGARRVRRAAQAARRAAAAIDAHAARARRSGFRLARATGPA